MAYFTQEKKKELLPKIKEILKKYGLKGSLSVRHHSTVVLLIKSGPIDFINNYNLIINTQNNPNNMRKLEDKYVSTNVYWIHEHFSGIAKECLLELKKVLNEGNWDKSDIATDYFNVGWYVDIEIGNYDKPYILIK